jgi:integrase
MSKIDRKIIYPIFSTTSMLSSEIKELSIEIDTKIDTKIEKQPKIVDYGGDVSKRWFIDYQENGKLKRRWIPARPIDTKSERAKRELLKIKKLYYKPSYNYATLDHAISRLKLAPKTISTYKVVIDQLKTHFPDYNSIDAKDFKEFLIDTYEQPKTVNNKLSNIKAVFSFALEQEFIEENPFGKTKLLPCNEDSEMYYPFSEYERTLLEPELQKNSRLWLFSRFVYFSFSRIKEIRNLQVKDIDLRTRTIRLMPENVKTNRFLVKPIVKPLLDLILEHGILNAPSNSFVFGYNLQTGFKPCQSNLPTTLHREALKVVGIYREDETSLYGWKHTGNINAYLKGMDIKLIQKMNGHSSLETTEVYLRKLGLFLDKQAFDFEF